MEMGGGPSTTTPSATCQTNVLSLVERFAFRPSSTETDLPNSSLKLSLETQYSVGVVMTVAGAFVNAQTVRRSGGKECQSTVCGAARGGHRGVYDIARAEC